MCIYIFPEIASVWEILYDKLLSQLDVNMVTEWSLMLVRLYTYIHVLY